MIPSEEESKVHDQSDVNVEEFEVRQVAVDCVEDHGGEEFTQRVQDHELEYPE